MVIILNVQYEYSTVHTEFIAEVHIIVVVLGVGNYLK